MHNNIVVRNVIWIWLRSTDGRLGDIYVDSRWDVHGSGINVKDVWDRQDFQIIDKSLCQSCGGFLSTEGLRTRRGIIGGCWRFTIVGRDVSRNDSRQGVIDDNGSRKRNTWGHQRICWWMLKDVVWWGRNVWRSRSRGKCCTLHSPTDSIWTPHGLHLERNLTYNFVQNPSRLHSDFTQTPDGIQVDSTWSSLILSCLVASAHIFDTLYKTHVTS